MHQNLGRRAKPVAGYHMQWLRELPFVKWERENFSKIPSTPGIYFVTDEFCGLFYIGKTCNLKHRVCGEHHAWGPASYACSGNPPYLRWLQLPDDEELLLTIENALIYQYQPPLNIEGKGSRPFLNSSARKTRRNAGARKMAIKLSMQDTPIICSNKDKSCPSCSQPQSTRLILNTNNMYIVKCKYCGHSTNEYDEEGDAYYEWGSGAIAQ